MSFGIGAGAFAVILAHDPQLLNKLVHRRLPSRLDVLHRVHGWKEMATVVGTARNGLEAKGKPAFIICEHYGFTSQISFYLPEAKRRIQGDPIVFYVAKARPENQFYYWPNYLARKGDNAIFVRELERPRLRTGWFSRWWKKEGNLYAESPPPVSPPPDELRQQFESVTDTGTREILAGGEVLRRIQLFECRNLR
jgi:hypothetical protein